MNSGAAAAYAFLLNFSSCVHIVHFILFFKFRFFIVQLLLTLQPNLFLQELRYTFGAILCRIIFPSSNPRLSRNFTNATTDVLCGATGIPFYNNEFGNKTLEYNNTHFEHGKYRSWNYDESDEATYYISSGKTENHDLSFLSE